MPADDSGPADPSLNVANEEHSSVGSTSSSPRSTAQGVLPQIAVQLPDHVARKVELSRIQFFKTVKKLLIQRLPDDVRRTMTEDDLPSLTPDSLDRAATWRELKNISNEAADRLAEIAARFVAEKDRLQWIDEQLEEWEAQIVGDGRQGTHPDVVGAQRSIVELACLVLRERRGIGTDSSRKILEDNLGEAIEGAKSQVSSIFDCCLRRSHAPGAHVAFCRASSAYHDWLAVRSSRSGGGRRHDIKEINGCRMDGCRRELKTVLGSCRSHTANSPSPCARRVRSTHGLIVSGRLRGA